MENLGDYQLSTLQGRFFVINWWSVTSTQQKKVQAEMSLEFAVFVFGKRYGKSQRFFNLTFQGKICVINWWSVTLTQHKKVRTEKSLEIAFCDISSYSDNYII